MSWPDMAALRQQLEAALRLYDWGTARSLCQGLVQNALEARSPCPTGDAVAILKALRAKRRFPEILMVAEAFVFSGQDAPLVRKHYAQALIDSGLLLAAEPVLRRLADDSFEGDSQVEEAHGLLGRVSKQRFVNARRPDSRYVRAAFERSLAEYLQTYRLNPLRNYWHGVNAVALIHRAAADHIPIVHAPQPDLLAREILETLRNAPENGDPFALATRGEALLSLRDFRGAEDALLDYSRHPNTDAFEAASTLRQFEEVWRLRDDEPPGQTLLPLLRAARMRGENGSATMAPAEVNGELQQVRTAQRKLEAIFGFDRTVTLQWYATGLERAKAVARIEAANGRGKGTGWLVKAEDFFANRTGLLLLTNAHVINETGAAGGLKPGQAVANFQGLQQRFALGGVVWSSPWPELDATFVAFKEQVPAAVPIPICADPVELAVPAQRVYIMGHPDGRDLEFSIHDNKLVNRVERFLHYRTPTEGGSSGSPVFEHLGWEAIALHHAGEPSAAADGSRPAYEANEGIALAVLTAATRA